MSYSTQEENLIDITSIKTVRESLRYYQLHISKKINNIKYKIYDDEKLIDCGEIKKKSEKDSHKTCINFEYDLYKNYFIKIKYTLFGNDNVFSGHKFLLSNIIETKNEENIENNNKRKNIKIKIKKDFKEDEELKEDELSEAEEELESSASSSGSEFSSDNNEDNNQLITKYFESKYKFMNNDQSSIEKKDKYKYYSQDELNPSGNNYDNIDFNDI
jgi:hypothetical protein